MKDLFVGVVLVVVVYGTAMLLTDNSGASSYVDDGVRTGSAGHPLWSD